MKRLALALTCATLFAALPAHAQFQKPEDAIKYRKGAFTVMAAHFGRIGAMANGRVPFKGETRAKPEIWTDAAKFKEGSQAMIDAVGKLNAAAKTGNLDQIKAAFGDAGKTCKACHDNFRKE